MNKSEECLEYLTGTIVLERFARWKLETRPTALCMSDTFYGACIPWFWLWKYQIFTESTTKYQELPGPESNGRYRKLQKVRWITRKYQNGVPGMSFPPSPPNQRRTGGLDVKKKFDERETWMQAGNLKDSLDQWSSYRGLKLITFVVFPLTASGHNKNILHLSHLLRLLLIARLY